MKSKTYLAIITGASFATAIMANNSCAQNKAAPAPQSQSHFASPVSPAAVPGAKRVYVPLTVPFEVVGEVVDAWCYSSQVMGPGRGESHKACGLACAHGGVTMGIVDDKGTLYVAAKHKGFTGCKELLIPYMAKRVKAVGWLAQKGGCNMLKIKTVEEVKSK